MLEKREMSMEKLAIKVNILGRNYPMTVLRSEENSVRQAAQKVNDLAVNFQATYTVSDKQDLLAMAALQIAAQAQAADGTANSENLRSSLEEISKALDF